jgi:hypothetical protein
VTAGFGPPDGVGAKGGVGLLAWVRDRGERCLLGLPAIYILILIPLSVFGWDFVFLPSSLA